MSHNDSFSVERDSLEEISPSTKTIVAIDFAVLEGSRAIVAPSKK